MLESVKLKQRFKSVSRVQPYKADGKDYTERRFLQNASTNPSGIYNKKNRDLLPQIANAKMARKLNNAMNHWSPDTNSRITAKDAEILFLKSDRKVPPQLSDSHGQKFKLSGKQKLNTITLTERDHTKILEQQMLDTMIKIDVGLSKRFNPKLIPLKNKFKASTTQGSFIKMPNFHSFDQNYAITSIRNVDDHLSQLSQTRTSNMGDYNQAESPDRQHNSSVEKLNKGFDAETIKEFGLTENDHIGGTYHKHNYVEKNITQAQVYRQIQTQNQFFNISLNKKSNRTNLSLMKDKREIVRVVDRNNQLTKMDKWNEFRIKREEVMDNYVKVLKRSKALTLLMKYRKIALVLKTLCKNIETTRAQQEREIKMAFICINIRYGWRRVLRRWGSDNLLPIPKPDIFLIHQRRLRHALTINQLCIQDESEKEAKKQVTNLVIKACQIEHIIEKGRMWHRSITFIQKQMRARLAARGSKEYMMDAAWDKLFGKLMNKAISINDAPTKEMLNKIAVIDHEVKEAVCKYYIDQCIQLGAIAFLQWRLEYPSEVNFKEQELEEIIMSRIAKFFEPVDLSLKVSEFTLKASAFPKKFKQNYSECIVDKNLTYLIDDCEAIGITDPFPNDDEKAGVSIFNVPVKADDFVYPVNRLVFSLSPSTIYLPSKKILFKMMRACIGVNTIDDLWFNQNKHEE